VPLILSEDYECSRFAAWLDANKYLYSHLPLSTFTRSLSVKAKNKRLGVRPGVPDYVIVLKAGRVVWVEMKRQKGGQVSVEQKIWLVRLNDSGTPAKVCEGFEVAKHWILEQENVWSDRNTTRLSEATP
jgi:VRR-NUC domain